MRFVPTLLSLMAGACFIAAFLRPLVCSDFSLEKVPYIDAAEDWLEDPCGQVVDAIHVRVVAHVDAYLHDGWIDSIADKIDALSGTDFRGRLISWVDDEDFWTTTEEVCEDSPLDEKVRSGIYGKMDQYLGEVQDPRTGREISWAECYDEVEDGADSSDVGSCCANEEDSFQTCAKWWVIGKGGVPIGDQYLLEIIQRLFQSKDLPLALLLVLFSICFPLLKVGMSLYASLRPSGRRTMRFLSITSKWSMTDVFLVALLITFFKAESFNFRFQAGTGLYFFASGAILSSLAVTLLERQFRSRSNTSQSAPSTPQDVALASPEVE